MTLIPTPEQIEMGKLMSFSNNAVCYKKLSPNMILPRYAKPGDAALTLFSPESFLIYPGEVRQVNMGYALWIRNEEWAGLVVPRSGKGTAGLVVANLVGVIDCTYQGELIVQCWNRNKGSEIAVAAGDGIAQLMVTRRVTVTLEEVEEFSESTERGQGGFGSTDKQEMRLENWFKQDQFLYGEVYGNPKFPEGFNVRTSVIREIKDGYAYTQNSVYKLGTPADPSQLPG